MSIALLNQVYDETRRLVIAGSNLAVGDFRLKKLVVPLRKSGKRTPVFEKLASAIETVVDGDEKQSPQALLELSSLVLAVSYTQGESGLKGTSKPIETTELDVSTTQVSSRVLRPLLDALTSTGSGRLETVEDAFQRGAFKDLRLVNPAINALDDGFSELADFIAAKVLPQYGTAIIPHIKDNIDMSGRAGNVRRLRLLYELDPKIARPLVEEAFTNGSKEMKIAALGCLGDSKEDLPHLLDQAKARAKEVRRVAISRLAQFKDSRVEAIFEKAIQGADIGLVIEPIKKTSNAKLVKSAIDQTTSCLSEYFDTKDKKKAGKLTERLVVLFSCFEGRSDKPSIDLLKHAFSKWPSLMERSNRYLVGTLAEVILATNNKPLISSLAKIHQELPEADEAFNCAVTAVLTTAAPKNAFNELSGYYVDGAGKKSGPAPEKKDMVRSLLRRFHHGFDYDDDNSRNTLEDIKFDAAWLKLAITHKDTSVVSELAGPKDKAAAEYLVEFVRSPHKKTDYWEQSRAMAKLVEIGHKEATDIVLEGIVKSAKQKSKRHWYYGYYLFPLISKLPKASAKKVEAALEGLPDSFIDQIMPHLLTLKQKGK